MTSESRTGKPSKMMKKEKPMMSVTAIIQGTQAQHWARGNTCTYIHMSILCNCASIAVEANMLTRDRVSRSYLNESNASRQIVSSCFVSRTSLWKARDSLSYLLPFLSYSDFLSMGITKERRYGLDRNI